MRHFVQFHNPDFNGDLVNKGKRYSIWTRKNLNQLTGQRIWLITKTQKPRTYYVGYTFIVDEIKASGRGKKLNYPEGLTGRRFGTWARIDTEKWWDRLMSATGNFRFGLTEIRDKSIIEGLERIGRSDINKSQKITRASSMRKGAGFGKADKNKRVEIAAINHVTRHFEKNGWTVKSVESEGRGYDLVCRKNSQFRHIEVKGVSGSIPSFIITSNEVRESSQNLNWHMAVVTNTLSGKPVLKLYDAKKFRDHYNLTEKDYYANKK
jgi:hypothetical protein